MQRLTVRRYLHIATFHVEHYANHGKEGQADSQVLTPIPATFHMDIRGCLP